ncbi:MAG: hypothetical protein LBQ66_09650 [Planctomycetaceae bacterium]|nr:hypothetical protein [Planctomycetaceae bacterium]
MSNFYDIAIKFILQTDNWYYNLTISYTPVDRHNELTDTLYWFQRRLMWLYTIQQDTNTYLLGTCTCTLS